MTHGVESVHSEYGIGCHSKKRVSGSRATDYPNLAVKLTFFPRKKAKRIPSWLQTQHSPERPWRLFAALSRLAFSITSRAQHLRMAVQAVKVPQNRFDPTPRNNRHEKHSPEDARNTGTHPDRMRHRAAGRKARAQQRRTEEGRTCGILLPRTEGLSASAQCCRIPARGRKDDDRFPCRCLGIFHRDS